jgi:NAD(P)-dependent dehydrogenase (short-subunit alcohol dehydrogenase family)
MAEKEEKKIFPEQEQELPGSEAKMMPRPIAEEPQYKACGKLEGKVALITGGDSGIGRAVAIAFAKEGANVAILYLSENQDAEETKHEVESEGRRCISIAGDVGDYAFCEKAVEQTVRELGGLDCLVNNAAEQHEIESLEDLTSENIERTFRTNIFAYFYLAKLAARHMKDGSTIINTTSVTAYRGSPHLLTYASTKGAIVAFTRSLAGFLVESGIRVNGVAPGPVWTPLIAATFEGDEVAKFGTDVPMGRPGQPVEIAPCYVFLASEDSSYMTGQILHPNGGEIING